MFRFFSGRSDQQPTDPASDPALGPASGDSDEPTRPETDPAAEASQPINPLRRTDLASTGARGVAERVLIGKGTFRRLLTVLLAVVLLGAAASGTYGWLVGFSKDDDFFNPLLGLMVLGTQIAPGFFPRTPERQPYLGHTIVSALHTAALLYIVFVFLTQPLDKGSAFVLLAYAILCLLGFFIRFVEVTRDRRALLIAAEQAEQEGQRPEMDEALRRALHMDR